MAMKSHIPVCRFCKSPLSLTLVDLGDSPIANDYLVSEADIPSEKRYPLHIFVCTRCWLAQTGVSIPREHIFSDHYAYFSSYSSSWLDHARRYTDMAAARFTLSKSSLVVEAASNDGYMLQYFKEKGIPVVGIEPTKNTAATAIAKGIPTETVFLGADTAKQLIQIGIRADLLIANNVMAHVPDINDFVAGLSLLLRPEGILTAEFPHLLKLMEQVQFDTIYHEHYSYYSFMTISAILRKHGMEIFDVDELPTHGGSLRIYAQSAQTGTQPQSTAVKKLLETEKNAGLNTEAPYRKFSHTVGENKKTFLSLIGDIRKIGASVVGYGAPAKGNTLLNFYGIGPDTIAYTVDKSPHKQGTLLPGSHIPVFAPEKIRETRPDYVLILPWNLKNEIMAQLSYIRQWGGKIIIPIPIPVIIGL